MAENTLIGRQINGSGIAILHGSVSRPHAHLSLDGKSGTWIARDLGSSNGATLNGASTSGATPLRHRDILVADGVAGFVFLEPLVDIPDISEIIIGETFRPDTGIASPVLQDPTLSELFGDDGSEDITTTTLRVIGSQAIRAHGRRRRPGRGRRHTSAALAHPVRIFELAGLAHARPAASVGNGSRFRAHDRAAGRPVLGPMKNHVKQLVRRVRRALIKAEIGDLIESRHRFGYRLQVIPRDTEC